MPRRPIRVVKVGGSLFELPDLRTRLTSWLAKQTRAANVLIAGGGALTDTIGQLQRIHYLPDVMAHWMCIDALRITADFLNGCLQWENTYKSPEDLATSLAEGKIDAIVFDPHSFAQIVSMSPAEESKLPCDWTVTSDSIAARFAQWVGAEEFVLLKSALPATPSVSDAVKCGYVDEFFEKLAPRLRRIRCVNLRDDAWPECELRVKR